MQYAISDETLDRRHGSTRDVSSRHDTRADKGTVNEDAAGSARGLATAILSAGKPSVLSQPVEQGTIRRAANVEFTPVDHNRGVLGHQFGTTPEC